jgi:hypothetical protein
MTIEQNSFNAEAADTLEILILQHLTKIVPSLSASVVEWKTIQKTQKGTLMPQN